MEAFYGLNWPKKGRHRILHQKLKKRHPVLALYMPFWLCGSQKNFLLKRVGFEPAFRHHSRLEFNTTGFYREGTFKDRLSTLTKLKYINYILRTSLSKIAGVKTLRSFSRNFRTRRANLMLDLESAKNTGL